MNEVGQQCVQNSVEAATVETHGRQAPIVVSREQPRRQRKQNAVIRTYYRQIGVITERCATALPYRLLIQAFKHAFGYN